MRERGAAAVQVALGPSYGLCLGADGAVEGWGRDSGGVTARQAGPFVAVAGAALHAIGLRADGCVKVWGEEWVWRAREAEGDHCGWKRGPYVAVAACYTYVAAVRADGGVDFWGEVYYDLPMRVNPSMPAGTVAVHSRAARLMGMLRAAPMMLLWHKRAVERLYHPSRMQFEDCLLGLGGNVSAF